MTVPTFSAVTSRKFGGSTSGWRGRVGAGWRLLGYSASQLRRKGYRYMKRPLTFLRQRPTTNERFRGASPMEFPPTTVDETDAPAKTAFERLCDQAREQANKTTAAVAAVQSQMARIRERNLSYPPELKARIACDRAG
jgi:hypothetical protein